MSKRKMHPNSLQALKDAVARREVTKMRVNMTLTEDAIASLDRIATTLGVSRSELVERLARVGDERIMEVLGKGEEG